jgi:hypothetical protein
MDHLWLLIPGAADIIEPFMQSLLGAAGFDDGGLVPLPLTSINHSTAICRCSGSTNFCT